MSVRIARVKNEGRRIDLVILNGDYQLEEVVRVVGPSQPLLLVGGERSPNGDRTTIEVAGAAYGHLCLNIEGQIIPFLQAVSSIYPEESATDLSLRLGTGTIFKVV